MAGRNSAQLRRVTLQAATAIEQRGWKTQPGGGLIRARHFAATGWKARSASTAGSGNRHRGEQVPWCRDAAGCRTARRIRRAHDAAEIHHRDPLAEMRTTDRSCAMTDRSGWNLSRRSSTD